MTTPALAPCARVNQRKPATTPEATSDQKLRKKTPNRTGMQKQKWRDLVALGAVMMIGLRCVFCVFFFLKRLVWFDWVIQKRTWLASFQETKSKKEE